MRVLRIVARVILGAVLVVGWLSLILAVLLFSAEKTGVITRLVRDAAATRLGSLGHDLKLDEVRLHWFEPAIEVDGITFGRGGEWLKLQSARVELGVLGPRGLRIDRIEVRGGRLRLSPVLIDGLKSYEERVQGRSALSGRGGIVPTVRIEDVSVEIESTRFGLLPLGSIVALLRPDERGKPELWGRVVPTLAASAAESGEIFVHGKVREADVFEVRATATHLPLGTDFLPVGSDLDFVRPYEPSGSFELDASGLIGLDGSVAPRARARMQIHDGSFRVAAGGQRVTEAKLDLSGTWQPSSIAQWQDPSSWRSEAQFSGRIDQARFESTAVFGPDAGPGMLAKAWLHATEVPLDPTLPDLFQNPPAFLHQWEAFDPRGRGEVWVAARLPAGFASASVRDTPVAAAAGAASRVQIAAMAHFDGRAGLTYHGYRHGDSGERNHGFPLPLEKITGDIVFARDASRLRPMRIGLRALNGDSGSAILHASGLVQSHPVDVPPFLPGYGYAEFDISIATQGLANDDRLRTGLAGLSGAVDPETTWKPLQPTGGNVDIDFRIAHVVDLPYAGVEVGLGMHGVALAWNDLPVPITPETGRFEFRYDGRSERGLGFQLTGPLRTAQRMTLAARMQTDTSRGLPEAGGHLDDISAFDVDIEHAALTGDDKKIFVARFPDIGAQMDEASPRGFADVHFERVRHASKGVLETRVEVTPRDPAQLNPKQFQMITTDVRGRVLVGALAGALASGGDAATDTVRARLMPLVGNWGSNVPVAFMARFPEKTLSVFGAGIDPSSKSLLGSLRQAMSLPGGVSSDAGGLQAKGALDFRGEIKLSDGPEHKNTSHYRFFLRDSALETSDGLALDSLRGELTVQDEQLHGEKLEALLSNTPVVLRDTSFRSGKDGYRLETRFDATGVPLDREHLGAFIGGKSLDALLDELRWSGTIDVRNGHIVASGPPQGKGRLEFDGSIAPHDMFIQLGLPINVKSASATIRTLVYEGGKVRAIVSIDGFNGLMAGRELEDASMLLTYVEPKLSVENLTGKLEGGKLSALGGDATRRGTVFSIALEPPFHFQVALGLQSVQAGDLLQGLFSSDIATRGTIDADMRLSGDMDHLLGVAGSGSIKVLDSKLWSIPAFRALFGQLGLDSTAVFDSMSSNFEVRDGRIDMHDITVRSPLLQLVGQGSLDFDGGLKYDLEVRYDLIDRLGPFTRLLYSIQNQLLSVAIRGDMSRPEILFKNPWTSLFGHAESDKRALPLPPWSSLPARF